MPGRSGPCHLNFDMSATDPLSRIDDRRLDAHPAGAVVRGLRRAWPLALIALLAGTAFAFDLHDYLDLDAFLDRRAAVAAFVADHRALALLALVTIYVAVVALSVPCGLALTMAAGFLFGPVVGGLAAAFSATVGATIVFLAAKTSLGEGLRAKAGPRLERMACGVCRDAFHYVLFLRLVPVAPFWLVNLAPALIGVPTRAYVLATAVGILPATFVFAALGAGLDSVIDAQEAANAACLAAHTCTLSISPRHLVTPELLAALAGLGVLSLIPVLVRRRRRRRGCG